MGSGAMRTAWAAVLLTALTLLLGSATTAAAAQPALLLTPSCDTYTGEQGVHYGVGLQLSGLAPNAPFTAGVTATILDPAGAKIETVVPAGTEARAEDNGGFSIAIGGPISDYPVRWTVTINYAGAVIERSLVVDCEPDPAPTMKQDCKKGGWRRYGFRNQGRCIASLKGRAGHHRA